MCYAISKAHNYLDVRKWRGYKGKSAEDVQAVGRSGNGGIDGIIKVDPLGLNVVYIQAKWKLMKSNA